MQKVTIVGYVNNRPGANDPPVTEEEVERIVDELGLNDVNITLEDINNE